MNVTIRRMTAADIPAGLRLSAQNGWNQLPGDWRRQLDLEADGCFVAELDNQVVGTACACVFHTVAWINLVLVDQQQRGRGIGTALLRHVLAWLDQRHIPSIRLDATPLGQPLYEKFGFAAEYELTRYQGIAAAPAPANHHVTAATVDDLRSLAKFDQRITGTPRAKLMEYLWRQSPSSMYLVREREDLVGYAAFRPGARAVHIGPCLGAARACRQLLPALAHHVHGQAVFLDVPRAHAEANALASTLGLTAQRRLTRMGRGVRVVECLDEYWASFGPEKG